ncbi:MAG TPA: gamma-glutamyltransferase family protein, partial [Alphaproteobacteria bacterium]|nr:gamma-glutamyltransferase family protein [Alphaproteobacteria bacterium]
RWKENLALPTQRPALLGTRHMAVAGHYLAAHAAFRVLEAGGNAVDAGCAAGIALGVVQPDIVNVAGVAPIILYLAERDEVLTVSGLGTWPKAATAAYFRERHGGKIPSGILRTVVPAAPDAWITALARFGTMSFADVAADAIRLARDGFATHPLMADLIAQHADEYARDAAAAKVFLAKGRAPKVGEVFVQADLGRTLQHMADEDRAAAARGGRLAGLGAARDAFYKGDIAAAIVRFHRENGGLMTAEDMAGFSVGIEAPVRTAFAGTDIYACGPWCQGPSLLQVMNLLSPEELQAMGHNSVDYIHVLTEALKLAFADRERHFGDPRFVDVPIEGLLSVEYAKVRRTLIRRDTAWPEMPPAGDPRTMSATIGPRALERSTVAQPAGLKDTSYICVIDRWGNAFSATPSDSSFDGVMIPGTGLCPSSRGSQSWTAEHHPSRVEGGKRPRLTPNPALAIRRGAFVLPFGSPGGDVQIQAMLQVFLNIVLFGMDPQQAVEAPRFATFSFPDSFEPHAYFPGRLNIEARLAETVGDALSDRGHKVERWPDQIWRAGAVCAIVADQQHKLMAGGADPRRPSYAAGW